MTPYYEHDGVTLYHGDCVDVLPVGLKANHDTQSPPYETCAPGGGYFDRVQTHCVGALARRLLVWVVADATLTGSETAHVGIEIDGTGATARHHDHRHTGFTRRPKSLNICLV